MITKLWNGCHFVHLKPKTRPSTETWSSTATIKFTGSIDGSSLIVHAWAPSWECMVSLALLTSIHRRSSRAIVEHLQWRASNDSLCCRSSTQVTKYSFVSSIVRQVQWKWIKCPPIHIILKADTMYTVNGFSLGNGSMQTWVPHSLPFVIDCSEGLDPTRKKWVIY